MCLPFLQNIGGHRGLGRYRKKSISHLYVIYILPWPPIGGLRGISNGDKQNGKLYFPKFLELIYRHDMRPRQLEKGWRRDGEVTEKGWTKNGRKGTEKRRKKRRRNIGEKQRNDCKGAAEDAPAFSNTLESEVSVKMVRNGFKITRNSNGLPFWSVSVKYSGKVLYLLICT